MDVEERSQKDNAPPSSEAPEKFGRTLRAQFLLEPECTYLNHGSYGALARPVADAANALRLQAERQPSRFMVEELPDLIRDSADSLGKYLGARGRDIVFVDNATTAVNAVLRSLAFLPGDEVVTTSFCYNAVRKTLEFITERANARLVTAEIPFPLISPADTVQAIASSMTRRTRLLVVDHVSSETGLVLPINDIVRLARSRNIPVLVDGAHAPGMLPVKLDQLDATWYAGNCHKWLGAPRGSGFLWTYSDFQPRVRPTTISHFVSNGYNRAFDWPGTKDFSAWLSVPAAIDFRASLGEAEIYAYCRRLTARAARLLSDTWQSDMGSPRGMMGFVATVALPSPTKATPAAAERIRHVLRTNHNLETFVKAIDDRFWVRVSAYVYNDLSEFERLAELAPKVAAEL
ncbi:aminotransferase class V-fold PLP-dependent enzyme [Hwanghaeella grinnelliae]|uniref:Aminotransferase class V-fold PLP-dependent enzyme n=1 Tax=Hwanghaeella grinnelliae TaxID=2500179 RepID=A0A437QMX7_9PROT|nr:aminotransferase class V-fold PLP-dependent enzyme [Hwanghaeella grinnelliae]RVU35888.1 aminotransferase class V-fold PLP-dependent enzyme [Hwanghaeella grinnelliae]